jgi:hypothetical protein
LGLAQGFTDHKLTPDHIGRRLRCVGQTENKSG